MRKLFILIVLVLSIACQKQAPTKLTILHTNDHHGRYWKDKKGRYGMAARMTLVKKIRSDTKNLLLLSGGDINTGTPESDMFDARPDFEGMNLLGYDAMAVGNHEFDNSLEVLKGQQKFANFPFLSANIYMKKSGERMFPSHIIKEIDGKKIAIVGFTTRDTVAIVMDRILAEVDFRSPVEEAKKIIPEIQKENPDLIIAVTHMGHYPNGDYGAKAPGDVTLAKAVKGIDIIIGGHTQKPLLEADVVNGTRIYQAGEWGKYVGRIDIELTKHKANFVSYRLIPVNYKTETKLEEDAKMLSLLSPYYQQAQEKMTTVVGTADCSLNGDRKVVRTRQSKLGQLIAKAQLAKAGADIAVVNGGGIRDSLPKGNITLGNIYQVHPFGNTVTIVKLKGDDFEDFLEGTIKRVGSADNGAYPHFAGITFDVETEEDGDKEPKNIKINGQPFDKNKEYSVTLNNFIAQGKEDYLDVRNFSSFVDTGYSDAMALKEYIEKNNIKCGELTPQFNL